MNIDIDKEIGDIAIKRLLELTQETKKTLNKSETILRNLEKRGVFN